MFFRKNKTQSKTKITSLLIGLGLCFLLKPNVTTYAADNSGYVLGIAPDFNRFMYQTIMGTEEHNIDEDNYSEFKSVIMRHKDWKKFDIPTSFNKTWNTMSAGGSTCWGGTQKCTMFLFPANNSNAADYGPTEKDSNAISRVTSQVLTQLNQAILFVYNNAEKNGKPLSAHELSETEKKELFAEITGKLGNATTKMYPKDVKHSETFTITGTTTTFTITEKSKNNSFLTLKTDTGESVELRYRIQKYPEGKTEGTDDYDRSGEHPTIYWSHLIIMGNASYVYRGVQADNISELASEGFVAELLYKLLNSALTGVRNILGLEEISDIVFNQDNYAMRNWRGIAPTDWFEAGNILMWITQIIAWLALALALAWRFGSTMWGTVTTFKYVTLVESIKDIFTASISTALIYPIFMTLTNFNVLLVDIMANLTIFNDRIDTGSIGGGTIAGILISLLFFGIEIYFNFTYLLRGVTIVLLYGLAPIFFMVYAFGGGFKSITMRFIKELIGNIFIHTFHATFLAFFAIFMNTATTGFFTQIVLLYAFIPMTKLFKSLTGIGESDFISSTAEQAKDTFKSAGTAVAGGVVGGVVGGITAGKMKGSKSGGDNGGGGGSSYKGDSMSDNFGGDTAKGSLTGRVTKTVGKKISNSQVGKAVGEKLQDGGKLSKAVNFAKKGASLTAKGATKAKNLYNSAGGQMLTGAAKGVGGAVLAGSGAILGSKELSKTGQKMTSDGISGSIHSGKEFVSDLEETLHGREVQSSNPSHIGGYYNEDGSRTDTYSKEKLAQEIGVEDMDFINSEHGNQFRQKINTSNLSEDTKEFLENIELDSQGNVQSSELRNLGMENVKKTQDGKYIVSYNAEKLGINSVKRSGNKLTINQSGSNAISQNHLIRFKKEEKESQYKKSFML